MVVLHDRPLLRRHHPLSSPTAASTAAMMALRVIYTGGRRRFVKRYVGQRHQPSRPDPDKNPNQTIPRIKIDSHF
jgi:hypothetical protein